MSAAKFVIPAMGIIAFAGAATSGLVGAKSGEPAFVFETARVTEGDIKRVVATTGTVRPRVTVQVGSELSGRIKTIVADFNTKVQAGDLLAVIEPKTFESKARQAKADVLSAEAHVGGSEAALKKAKAVLENAEKTLSRQRLLDRKGLSPATTVETAERDVNVARAEIEVAAANVKDATALLAQKQAQHDQAVIDLERTQIRAPIGGIVLHRAVDVGQTVAASFQAPELFRLAGDLSSIHIEALVGEADIGGVKAGQRVTFDVDAYPGRKFKGTVEQIRLSPAAAESVVTYTVIVNADNQELLLYPGMTANVSIETGRRENVVRLPADAVHYKPPKQLRAAARSDEVQSLVSRWTEQLGLDDAQAEALRARLASDADGDKVKGESGEAAVGGVLRPDQRQRLAEFRKKAEGTQRASVWVLDENGAPRKRAVRVGISDLSHVELASNELKPGDSLIVRSRKARAP